MRLLYVSADPGIPVLGHKGASVHLRELVTALTAEGARVAVASPRVASEGDRLDAPVDLIELEPVVAKEHSSAASVRAAMERQAQQVMRIAVHVGVDAVYERYSLYSLAAAQAAQALRLPYVLEVNAPLRDEARRFRSLAYPDMAAEIEARVYLAADRIFVVSRPLAKLLVGAGVDRGKVEVMRNAVTPDRFPARRHHGPGLTVGFAGSLKPWHGVEVLTDAVTAAAQKVFDLRLEVVGDGPLARVLDRVNLPPERFRRYGARPHAETLKILSSWDIGVAPYVATCPTFYFSPLKVVEYMAAGACPVASDLGDIRSLLGDEERGILVPPGDASALTSALIELARDRRRLASIGARARKYAHASLSWRGNARRVLDCLGSAPARGLVHARG
jgi:glycosyltransferase involved in cell wall biosynthesis